MIPPMIINILANFGIFLIVTLSLNLEVGFGGIAQFGRVLAVIVGAFVAGGLAGRIVAMIAGPPPGLEQCKDIIANYTFHLCNFKWVDSINSKLMTQPYIAIGIFILTLILAAIIGGVVGWLTSYPAIRLKEAYLGITLLAFGDFLIILGWNYHLIIGGTEGIFVPDPFRWAQGLSAWWPGARTDITVITILVIAFLTLIYLEMLAKSPFGRALKAMRDDELAAKVYGKDIVKLRAQTLIIGSAIAAVGGALWALYVGSVKAVTYNRLTWTFWPWAYMMLGGTGNNLGIALGVFIFVIIRTIIFGYKSALKPYVPFDPAWLEYLFIGIVIVVIALFRPQGILPERPELTVSKRKIDKILKSIRQSKK